MFKDHPCHAPVQVGFDALLLCDDEDLREIGLLKGPRVKILRKKRRPPPPLLLSILYLRKKLNSSRIIGWNHNHRVVFHRAFSLPREYQALAAEAARAVETRLRRPRWTMRWATRRWAVLVLHGSTELRLVICNSMWSCVSHTVVAPRQCWARCARFPRAIMQVIVKAAPPKRVPR